MTIALYYRMKNLLKHFKQGSQNTNVNQIEQDVIKTEKNIKRMYVIVFTLFVISAIAHSILFLKKDVVRVYVYECMLVVESACLSTLLVIYMCLLSSSLNRIASEDFKKEKQSITTMGTIFLIIYLLIAIKHVIYTFVIDVGSSNFDELIV